MQIDKEQYNSIKNEVVQYSKEYQDSTKVNQFVTHIEEKLNNFKPTIMVYGTYNSGKSTLINALFGKDEMAKTGDAPETSTIHAYEYNGFTIYDTPGINAPQEHETVTNEHLKKTELVLFVLSNDGSLEEKYIYEKISDIVKLKKPILIVVNNKAGTEKDSLEEVEQFNKINLNLSKIGDEKNIKAIENSANICMINAKTALKAKLKQQKILLKNSNITQLEYDINKLLEKSGSSEVENALTLFIKDYIYDTLTIIDAGIDNPEMKKVQQNITYLESLKQRKEIELQNIIQESTAIVARNLLELLLQKDQNTIATYIDKTIKEIQELLNKKIKSISDEISLKIDNFNKEFYEISLNTETIDTSFNEEQELSVQDNTTNDSNTATTAALAGAAVAINVVPPVIVVGPFPVPARLLAQVALAIVGVLSGSDNKREEAQGQMDSQRSQRLAVKNKADEFGFDYKNKLFAGVEEQLNNVFNPTLDKFSKLSGDLHSSNKQLLEDKKALQNLAEKL